MPYSYIDVSATQGQTSYPTILDYVATNDIYVTVTAGASIYELTKVATLSSSSEPEFTVTATSAGTAFTVAINSPWATANIDGGNSVRIGRGTSITESTRTFADGSVLKASDLNTQNKQFLLTIQESLDNANTSLPITTTNEYDAGGRVIKNLKTGDNENDSVTRAYVDAIALYGGLAASLDPQAWSWTGGDGSLGEDLTGANAVYTLTDPVPATAVDNMFLVEIGGVLQAPTTDYTIVENNDSYTFTIIGGGNGSSAPVDDVDVVVRNFGATRNSLITPFKSDETTDVTVPIEGIGGQTADYIQIKDNAAAEKFAVDVDGAITIGGGGTEDVATTLVSKDEIEVGFIDTATTDNTGYGVSLTKVSSVGKVDIQAHQLPPAAAAVTTALELSYGLSGGSLSPVPFKLTYDGTVVTAGNITAASGTVSAEHVTATGTLQGLHGRIIGTDSSLHVGDTSETGSRVKITKDEVSGGRRMVLREIYSNYPGGLGADGVYTCVPRSDGDRSYKSAALGWGSDGSLRIGLGGNHNVATGYGGMGSLTFEYNNLARFGPSMRWLDWGMAIDGYRIPSEHGGGAGEDGTTPATLRYNNPAQSYTWDQLDENDIVSKKHVDSAFGGPESRGERLEWNSPTDNWNPTAGGGNYGLILPDPDYNGRRSSGSGISVESTVAAAGVGWDLNGTGTSNYATRLRLVNTHASGQHEAVFKVTFKGDWYGSGGPPTIRINVNLDDNAYAPVGTYQFSSLSTTTGIFHCEALIDTGSANTSDITFNVGPTSGGGVTTTIDQVTICVEEL